MHIHLKEIVSKDEHSVVANDENVTKIEFELDNQITSLLKLSDCNAIYINYQNGLTKDRYLVTDAHAEGDKLKFSWTLGGNATRKAGKTLFVICAQRTDGSAILQEWNSFVGSFEVSKGIEVLTSESKEYEDIFTQLIGMINSKQDKLIAGDGISIINNVISALGAAALRTVYTPPSSVVDVTELQPYSQTTTKQYYEIADDFTLTIGENSYPIRKGAIFVGNRWQTMFKGFFIGVNTPNGILMYRNQGDAWEIEDEFITQWFSNTEVIYEIADAIGGLIDTVEELDKRQSKYLTDLDVQITTNDWVLEETPTFEGYPYRYDYFTEYAVKGLVATHWATVNIATSPEGAKLCHSNMRYNGKVCLYANMPLNATLTKILLC